MHGLEMKSRKSKILLKSWCFLSVKCSTNCWIRFKHSLLSCAKTVLPEGVTAFHWGSVEKLIQTLFDISSQIDTTLTAHLVVHLKWMGISLQVLH